MKKTERGLNVCECEQSRRAKRRSRTSRSGRAAPAWSRTSPRTRWRCRPGSSVCSVHHLWGSARPQPAWKRKTHTHVLIRVQWWPWNHLTSLRSSYTGNPLQINISAVTTVTPHDAARLQRDSTQPASEIIRHRSCHSGPFIRPPRWTGTARRFQAETFGLKGHFQTARFKVCVRLKMYS